MKQEVLQTKVFSAMIQAFPEGDSRESLYTKVLESYGYTDEEVSGVLITILTNGKSSSSR